MRVQIWHFCACSDPGSAVRAARRRRASGGSDLRGWRGGPLSRHADAAVHAELHVHTGPALEVDEHARGWSEPAGVAGDADGVDAVAPADLADRVGQVVADRSEEHTSELQSL